MKFYLHSIGCRLNQSEIETMGRQLLANGHELVANAGNADRVIINSCAVTAGAVKDARRLTRRIHRQNENAGIVMTGCYATIAPNEVAQLPSVTQVTLNSHKNELVQLLDPQAEMNPLPLYEQEPILREFLAGNAGNTRAFIKVQDGCDHKCTFCITTVARGAGQSRHLGDVVAEIQALGNAGYPRSGINGCPFRQLWA